MTRQTMTKQTRKKTAAKPRQARRKDRQASRGPQPFRKWLVQGAVLSGIVVGLSVVGYLGKSLVEQASQRPINSIGVEGQFVYLSQNAVSEIVTPMIIDGFLQSPLSAIKAELESNPWISRATVSRRWPDELYISIVEEQPIARWGQTGFLNHKGDIVEVEANSYLRSLPLLTGNAGQAKTVMQNYQTLMQMLRPHGLKVSEFYSDELFSWNVVLSNGLRIHIGRDQTMEKIQRFLVVYKRELSDRLDEVAAVDLRYGNGLAVEWKTATADSTETTDNKLDEKA